MSEAERERWASMGPRLFRRGNGAVPVMPAGRSSLLQWGHVFSDVEMRITRMGQGK